MRRDIASMSYTVFISKLSFYVEIFGFAIPFAAANLHFHAVNLGEQFH